MSARRFGRTWMCLSPSPRTQLPRIIRKVAESAEKHNIRIVNVAHAGDGNIHPILLFDERDRDQVNRVMAASRDVLSECIRCQGSVTAEHGIGVEKIDFMSELYDPPDLEALDRVRESFNPTASLNPGKLLPSMTR